MIGCELTGGLGNQFFRYAYARSLQAERSMKDKMMVSIRADYHGQNSDIRDFQLKDYEELESGNLLLKCGYWWQILIFCMIKYSHSFLCKIMKSITLQKWEYLVLGKCGIVVSYNPDNEILVPPPKLFETYFCTR